MKYLVLGLLVLAACAASAPGQQDLLDVEVESWNTVDVAPLNARISEAAVEGHVWVKSPLMVTLEVIGGDIDRRTLSVRELGSGGEAPDTVTITMARDRFLDDSVRGDWHHVVLYRLDDWTWRFHEIRRAFRCYRGKNLETYGADLCP